MIRRNVIALLVGLAAFVMIGTLAAVLPFDYDEILHAHGSWLVAQNFIPHKDFLALHPGFFWFLNAPLIKLLPGNFDALLVLRGANALFSIAALGVIGLIIRRSLPAPTPNGPVLIAIGAALVQPSVAQTLVEFRPDQSSLLLILFGLYLAAEKDVPEWVTFFIPALLYTLGTLINPKLYLIPVISTLAFGAAVFSNNRRVAGRYVLHTVAGILTSAGFLALVCAAKEIPFDAFFTQVFRYHAEIAGLYGSESGLARELTRHALEQFGLPFLFLGLGMAGLFVAIKHGGWRAHIPALVLTAYAALQPFSVSLPFRQYQYAIYIAAAVPLAFLLARKRNLLIVGGLVIIGSAFFQVREWQRLAAAFPNAKQRALGNFLLAHCPDNYPVAAQIPYHPVFRKDAVFAWCETFIPNGHSMMEIMERFPGLATALSREGITQQLEKNPPGLIVLPPIAATGGFTEAAQLFAETRPGAYRAVFTPQLRLYQRIEDAATTASK